MPQHAPDAVDPVDDYEGDIVDLDEWLDTMTGEDAVDFEQEPTSPTDRERADWMLRKVARLKAAQDRDADLAASQIAKIEEWQGARNESMQRQIDWFERALEGFMRVTAERDGVRSLSLPNGKLALRKPTERLVVIDEDEFLSWGRRNGDTGIRVKVEVAKADLKKVVDVIGYDIQTGDGDVVSQVSIGGEVLPGVVMQRSATDTFTVTL